MRTRLCLLAFLAAAVLPLPAQTQPPTPPDDPKQYATLDGKTLGEGGIPLRKTKLTLRKSDAGSTVTFVNGVPSAGTTYGATSDAEGKFHYEKLPPGRYYLTGENTGYLRSTYGSRNAMTSGTVLDLKAGQAMTDIVLTLTPAAVISGRILDAEGDPMPRVNVRLLQSRYRNGKKSLQIASITSADSRGEFRFDSVAQGKYYLAASTRGNLPFGSVEVVKDSAKKPGEPDEDYVMTYYPNSPDASAAQPLLVAAGRQLPGTDIALKKLAVYHIRGKVTGGIPGKPLTSLRVNAVEANDNNGMTITMSGMSNGNIAPDGTFDLGAYRPGSYVAQVTTINGVLSTLARTRVELGNQDANDVVIAMQPLGEITGKILWLADQKVDDASAGAKAKGKNPDPISKMRLNLTALESGVLGRSPLDAKDDGSFSFPDVAPGKYKVDLSGVPPGAYVASMKVNGQDARTGFEVASGAVEVTIQLSPNAAQITGTVTDGTTAVPNSVVTVIPEPANPEQTWLYKRTMADSQGNFRIMGLIPGRYKVYAWEDMEFGAEYDQDFLQPFTGKGTDITVKESAKETVKVVRVAIPDLQAAGKQ